MIPTIKVRSVAWESHSTAEGAVSSARNDHQQTMAIPQVAMAVGSTIQSIEWSDTHLCLDFGDTQRLTLVATPEEIVLSDDQPLVAGRLPDEVMIERSNTSEPYLWERAAVLKQRENAVFQGLQLSRRMAFVYTRRQVPLMLTVVEACQGDGEWRTMLEWGNAE